MPKDSGIGADGRATGALLEPGPMAISWPRPPWAGATCWA